MPSMSAPSDGEAEAEAESAWHYDGRNANRWRPRIVPEEGGFRLVGDGWESGPYAWGDLAPIAAPDGRSVYGLKQESGWRLGFDGPPPAGIAPLLPAASRYGGIFDRFGLVRAAGVCAAVAAALVVVGLKAPGWIAPHIPLAWEERLGDAMVGDFGGRLCRTPEGTRALTRLVARVDPGHSARTISVANIPIVNAITLPGGRVILFDGLLQQARSGDEVAGVLGHELGHVRHRDTLTALVRQLGLSVILGGFSGNVGGYVNGLLSLSYGRDAERAADSNAIEALAAADISPLDTAGFFRRLGSAEPKGDIAAATGWISTHPLSDERRARFETGFERGRIYTPALDAQDWAALRRMCKSDRSVRPFFGSPF